MNIEIDPDTLKEISELSNDLFAEQSQCSQPSAGTNGATFSSNPLRFIATTTVIAIGTVAAGAQPVDIERFHGLSIVVHGEKDGGNTARSSAAQRFAELKRGIVAAGIPLLDDDSLRAEIRERKGKEFEPES